MGEAGSCCVALLSDWASVSIFATYATVAPNRSRDLSLSPNACKHVQMICNLALAAGLEGVQRDPQGTAKAERHSRGI